MKSILLIYPIFPYPLDHGGKLRVFNLLKEFNNDKNIKISLVTIISDKTPKENIYLIENKVYKLYYVKVKRIEKFNYLKKFKIELSIYPRGTKFHYNKKFLHLVKTLLEKNQYDFLHFESLSSFKYLLEITKWNKIFRNKNVFSLVDSISLFYYLKLKNSKKLLSLIDNTVELLKSFIMEFKLNYLTKYVYIISNQELKFLKILYKGKIFMASNGVDIQYFKPINMQKHPNSLIFTGNLAFSPNQDALKNLIEKLIPVLESRKEKYIFFVVGSNPPEWIKSVSQSNKKIIVTGFVENINLYLNSCKLFISWMSTGAGVKNKILEALACGLPVIGNYHSFKGIIQSISINENIQFPFIFVNSFVEMANMITKFLNNENLYNQKSIESRNFIKKYFNWNITKNIFIKIYNLKN